MRALLIAPARKSKPSRIEIPCRNLGTDEYSGHLENPLVVADDRATILNVHREGNSGSTSHAHLVECLRNHQDARANEVVWEDSIDPDNMTYEELLELGEAVGTQSWGLSQDQIDLLPTSKFKCGFFFRRKFKGERWSLKEVIRESLFHANMPTTLFAVADGLASIKLNSSDE